MSAGRGARSCSALTLIAVRDSCIVVGGLRAGRRHAAVENVARVVAGAVAVLEIGARAVLLPVDAGQDAVGLILVGVALVETRPHVRLVAVAVVAVDVVSVAPCVSFECFRLIRMRFPRTRAVASVLRPLARTSGKIIR